MRKKMIHAFVAAALLGALPFAAGTASAFQGAGCSGKCTDCHTLTKDEAAKILKTDAYKAQVKEIRMSQVKGLWELEIAQGDKVFPVYIDFSKKYLVEGRFTPVEQLGESKPLKKVDLKKIPLDNAIVVGNPKADKKIIVFDDPECPYCARLNDEMKKIVAKRSDVAFLVKMYPLAIHPNAYDKSKAIVCQKSSKLLDDAFAGKKLPKAECDTKELDDNIKLAQELGISGTPAIILPDGRLVPGFVPADVILGFLDNQQS